VVNRGLVLWIKASTTRTGDPVFISWFGISTMDRSQTFETRQLFIPPAEHNNIYIYKFHSKFVAARDTIYCGRKSANSRLQLTPDWRCSKLGSNQSTNTSSTECTKFKWNFWRWKPIEPHSSPFNEYVNTSDRDTSFYNNSYCLYYFRMYWITITDTVEVFHVPSPDF